MPSRTSSFRADSCTYPSDRELGRLATTIHSVAQGRGLSEKVAGRYEAWIFVFLGWCLRAPPRRVGRDRVGGFWTALTQRQVPKWKICVAMDALGFFFGALGGPEGLPGAPSFKATSGASTAEGASGQATLHRPNPTIEANPNKEPNEPGRSEKRSSYLPNGPLPTGVDVRRYVPTSNPKENQEKDMPVSEPGGPGRPKTLFNPEGKARPQRTSASKKEDKKEVAGRSQGRSREDSPRKAPPHEASPNKASPQSETASPNEEGAGPSSQPPARQEPTMVPIEIPETLAERIKEGARKLGLPPGLFAARALDLACNEIGIGRVSTADSEGSAERYQTWGNPFQSTGEGQSGASNGTGDPEGRPDLSENDRPADSGNGPENSISGSIAEGDNLSKDIEPTQRERPESSDGWFGKPSLFSI